MGFLTKLARSAGRGVVVGSSAALRGGGRILAVHVLPDEIVPSWKTQQRLKKTGSVISRTFSQSGKKSGKSPGSKPAPKKAGKTSAPSSGFGGNHRPLAAAPAQSDRTQVPRMLSFRGLPGFNILPQLRHKKNVERAARSFLDVNGNVLPVDPNFFDRNIWGRGGKLQSNQDWSKSSFDAVQAAASRVSRAGSRQKSFRDRLAAYSSPRPRAAAPLALPELFAVPAAPRGEINSYPSTPSRLARSRSRAGSRPSRYRFEVG